MNKPDDIFLKTCPRCWTELDPKWFVCPNCGFQIRPGYRLWPRALTWLAVLLAFIMAEVKIATHDTDAAFWFGAVFGLPLAYVFGKAVLFRILGKPLTAHQLRNTSLRATATMIAMLVVLPIVIGVAVLIFAFVVCSGMFGR